MGTTLRLFWQNVWQLIIKHLWGLLLIAVFVALSALIWVFYKGYVGAWDWTGARVSIGLNGQPNPPERTLWDWLGLLGVLAIPIVVGFGAAWFTEQQAQASIKENKDNQQDAALQLYIDKMSKLILKKKLHVPNSKEDRVNEIARIRTLTILRGLDPIRKGSVLQFLNEFHLIKGDTPVINLLGADLSHVDLDGANLSRLDLKNHCGVDLSNVNLSGANLSNADLSLANLSGADLSNAILLGAHLNGARLNGTNLNGAYLNHAELCKITQKIEGVSKRRDPVLWPDLNKAADLSSADLSSAHLHEANLSGAILSGANLSNTDLSGANLRQAKVTDEQLAQAKSLKGATMPDGSTHP